MENVLINFESDPSGLEPGKQGLVQLETLDKKVADQAKKTADAIQQRDKTISTGAQSSKKSIESLAGSFQNLDKSVVGGSYKKVFEELRNQLNLSNKELKSFYENLIKNSREDIINAKSKEDVATLTDLLNSAKKALADLGDQEDKSGVKTDSLRTRLMEAKKELTAMAEAGLKGTPAFEALKQRAGQLDDELRDLNLEIKNVGSDTRNIEGLIGVMSGAVGIFSAAQGATALFGDENEDLQKALLKVNAAMSILNGIQSVQTLLQKQSAASLLVTNALQKINVLQTYLQTAAESQYTVIRYGAIAAQRVLNAVMAANPVGILLVGIGALAALLLVFTRNTEEAARSQRLLNTAFEEGADMNNRFANAIADDSNRRIAQMKKNNASAAAIRAEELRSLKEQYDQTISFENSKQAQYDVTAQKLRDYAEGKRKFDKEDVDASKKFVDDFTKLQEKRFDLGHQIEIQELNNDAETNKEKLQNFAAYADARVLRQRAGSRDELLNQIAAIRARENEELNSEAKLAGEKAKIRAQADRDAQEVRRKLRLFDLNQEKDLSEAVALIADVGSRRELDAKLDSLNVTKKIEIEQSNQTHAELARIESEYQRSRRDLIKEYNRKVAEDAVNARIAEANTNLANLQRAAVDENNSVLIEAKKKLLDEQATLEVISISNSETNEETRRQKINAVYAKAYADKRTLEENKAKAEIEFNDIILTNVYNRLKAEQELIIAKNGAESAAANIAREHIKAIDDNYLQQRQASLESELNDGLISYQEYYTRKAALDKEASDNAIKLATEEETRKRTIRETALKAFSLLAQSLFERERAHDAALLQSTEALHNGKLITEKEYQTRIKKIKQQQAADEKKQAIFDVLIQQGPVILAGFKHGAAIGAIAASILAQLQLALTIAQPVPQFFKGTKKAPPGWKWVGEHGAELIYDDGGYPIVPHDKSKQLENKNYYDPKIMNDYNIPTWTHNVTMPVVSQNDKQYIEKHFTSSSTDIDYDKLGKSVAMHVGKLSDVPGVDVNIDENGLVITMKKGIDRIQYQNKRYSSR